MSSDYGEYFQRFSTKVIQRTTEYQMAICTFKQNCPDLPPRAWVKIFNVGNADALREVSYLMALKQFNASLTVVHYLHHIISKGKIYLFLELFDTMLAEEIRNRARQSRFWAEEELITHLERLAQVIFQLHAMRIVHRNISPDTIFVQGTTLLLGHFDDSKQIAAGVTEMFQSVWRGSDNYLSPQCYHAYHSGSQSTYEVSFKDDVWGLGRVVLDIATLKCNDDVMQFYGRPQKELNSYISKKLKVRYSSEFCQLVTRMMTMDVDARPSIDDLLADIHQPESQNPCSKCGRLISAPIWPCGHTICEDCIFNLLQEAVSRIIEGTDYKECGVCRNPIPKIFWTTLSPNSKHFFDILENKSVACISRCGAVHSIARLGDEGLKPYYCVCACGLTFCSYCRAKKGHGSVLGKLRPCPTFPYQ